MTLTAFLLIFISVFLHAFWNFASKKGNPSISFYCLMSCTSSVIAGISLFFVPIDWAALPKAFWIFLAGSVFSEFLYSMGLAFAYKTTDISLAYPLGRALPVLTVAGITTLFGIGHKSPSLIAFAGMIIIFLGSILMPLKDSRDFHWKTYINRSFGFILLVVAGTTGYTIFDSMAVILLRDLPGVPKTGASIVYLFLIELGLAAEEALFVLCVPSERRNFKTLFLKTPLPHFAGIASASAYLLVLLAMPYVTNVSYVQAFRQMSLPIGVLLGVFLLKEPCKAPKIAGITLIVTGLILSAF